MELISVIIPMYNAEPYIRCCLQSLFNQTCQNWEAVIIDDASTDRGLDICQELAARDQRIRIITQEHKGVSAARNRGLDAAEGEYIFFLDSDDAIHPLLLEEMLLQARRTKADLLSCGQAKLEPDQFELAVSNASVHDTRPVWIQPPHDASPMRHAKLVSAIGGKMIRRSAVLGLRFREDLFLGEDTYYISKLIRRSVRTAYIEQKWYYYLRHSDSLTRSQVLAVDPRRYDVFYLLQEDALAEGSLSEAQWWEAGLLQRLQDTYLDLCRSQNTEGMSVLRKLARAECRRPFFRSMPRYARRPFQLCFFSRSLFKFYPTIQKISGKVYAILSRFRNFLGIHDIGILTFYCSDNFGAMLQAYGLRTYLRKVANLDAAIVPYSPAYMIGRHWYIPYAPFPGSNGRKRCLKNARAGLKFHRAMGKDFFARRDNMRRFRRKYLTWHRFPLFLSGSSASCAAGAAWWAATRFGIRTSQWGCSGLTSAHSPAFGKNAW